MHVCPKTQLHHNIGHAHHDSMMTGHPGQCKTLELVSPNYWWLGISHYVASYVAGCDTCNCCKSFLTQKVGKLTPNRCRQENNLIYNPPTEPSLEAQSIP